MGREAELLRGRIDPVWSQGEPLHAVAVADQVDRDRYAVRGLDPDGAPLAGPGTRAADGFMSAVFDDEDTRGYLAVRGDRPDCLAVAVYRAVGAARAFAFLVLGQHRIAVVELVDRAAADRADLTALTQDAFRDRSAGGLLRGVGKLARGVGREMAESWRAESLADRPDDADLRVVLELPRPSLVSVRRWKLPMVPDLKHGPRHVEIQFADGSMVRLKTDTDGLVELTGHVPGV